MDLNDEKHNKKRKISNFEEKIIGGGPLIGHEKISHFEKKIFRRPKWGPDSIKINLKNHFYIVLRLFFHLKPLLSEFSVFSNRSKNIFFSKSHKSPCFVFL